jgi:hypothetical protein
LSQQKPKPEDKSVNLGRHKTACMVCKHHQCEPEPERPQILPRLMDANTRF